MGPAQSQPITIPSLDQLNITFPKQCLLNSISENAADTLDKNAVGNAIKSCMYVNNVPISGAAAAPTAPTAPSVKEGFDETFITQSADGSSLCITYNALFWIIILTLIVVLFLRYRNGQM